MNYSVDIIIPAFNADKYIIDALESIASQTRLPDHIIVVDDGSKDKTAEYVKKWKMESKLNVELIQQENRGLPCARNVAIRNSSADLIALLDADDMILPFHIEKLVKAFESHRDLILCFGDALIFNESCVLRESFLEGKSIEYLDYETDENGLRLLVDSVYSSLLTGSYIPTSATMFKRQAGESVGLYDENMHVIEDRDFLLRLSRVGEFAYYPTVFGKKREHECNITHKNNMLRNLIYQHKVLNKMIESRVNMNLNDNEFILTKSALLDIGKEILYTSSIKGMKVYLTSVFYLAKSNMLTFQTVNPKHFLRSLYSEMKSINSNSIKDSRRSGLG